jgi:effector-binding domain-containing protein
MPYEVLEKELPSQRVVSTRQHTNFASLGETFDAELDHILGRIAPLGSWPAGAPFIVFYNQPFKPEDLDVEIGVPVASIRPLAGEHELPAEHVAYTVHTGSYGAIGAAYEDLFCWIRQNGHTPVGPPRELYLVGPRHTDRPDEYVTEIEVPIR